jgi:TM2 domain-containing membrane protein YozV
MGGEKDVMNCATHTETPAAAFCRTCGKALCEQCQREVQGVIYCEACIANRMADTMPPAAAEAAPPAPTGMPSPALAALLGFIPGVGAVYNGQFMKGLLHVAVFVALIWITDAAGPAFGVPMIPFFVFYMVFDAYLTARARELGQPLPDPFGIERMFSGTNLPGAAPGAPPAGGTAGAPAAAAPAAGAAPAAAAGGEQSSALGPIILIGLGVLFLLNTMGLFRIYRMGEFWPVILIAIGLYLFFARTAGAKGGTQ